MAMGHVSMTFGFFGVSTLVVACSLSMMMCRGFVVKCRISMRLAAATAGFGSFFGIPFVGGASFVGNSTAFACFVGR
jgi:hypothetical protein